MSDPSAAIADACRGAGGGTLVLSANPIHDTGGGQRSAQLALELLERDHAVVFVAHGRVTETVDLGLSFTHRRLVQLPLRRLLHLDPGSVLGPLLALERASVLTQVPTSEWAHVTRVCRDAGALLHYDCIDRWDSELGRGWYRLEAERSLAREAEVLTASAPALVEHVERLTGRETPLLPNAYNARVFDASAAYPRPAELPTDRPIALYVGALWGGWMDWGLVDRAARAHPDRTFVFVGDHRGEGRGLPENCVFPGLKPHTELPAYLAAADVAFLPWSVDAVTQATSPLKVFEFVAMGLPVVAPELEPLAGVPGVRRCADDDAFVRALGSVRADDLDDVERARMRDFAEENSWTGRVDRLLGLHASARAARTAPRARARRVGSTVSVVIPAYDHERYVGAALDSVSAQTLAPAEIVVVDDGSTDRTAEVVRDRAPAGLRLVRQENRGAHRALNRAIALSRGEYVAILNSDDAWEPTRLEHAWGIARASRAGLVCGAVRLVDERGGPVDPDHPIARWYREARAHARAVGSLGRALRRHNVAVTTSNFFVHRALWERLGGFAPYRYVHDYDFLLRAVEACADRVVYVDEWEDVLYRVHAVNTISESAERSAEERARMVAALRRPVRRARRMWTGWRARGRLRGALDTVPPLSPMASVSGSVTETRPRRVGFVVESMGTGGLEEVVALLAQSLPASGVDTSVLCTRAGGPLAARLRRVGIPVTVADGDAGACTAWVETEAVDLVSSHFAPVAVVEALASRGVPVVETVQNVYAWLGPEGWAAERRRAEHVVGTVAVSETVARYHEAHTGVGPRWVVPNPVHPGRVARVPRAWARGRLGFGPDTPLFAGIGRLAVQKNLWGLLRAFGRALEEVPSARLALVGPAADLSTGALRRRHTDLFRSGAVVHFGPETDVGVVLSACDAYVSNAFHEGWSVAASEALWVGRPVLLSDTGGSAELVGAGGERGVRVPNPAGDPLAVDADALARPDPGRHAENERALAEAMVELLRTRDDWAARDEEIRAWARATLSAEAVAGRYLEVFRTVLAERGMP